jgi:hypothetical protein
MHLVGAFGRGFNRIHVSTIVQQVAEKEPKLLKDVKKSNVKDIAGMPAEEEDPAEDGEMALVDDSGGVNAAVGGGGEVSLKVELVPLVRSPSMDIQII